MKLTLTLCLPSCLLASTPPFLDSLAESDLPTFSEKNYNSCWLQCATHTNFGCLWKEPLGFTIHHPELIMLKKIKSYREWSALKKVYHAEYKINKNTWNKSWSNPEKNGLKVTCLMSLYFTSEENTMKNEIFLKLYIAPPPFVWGRIFTKYIEEFNKLLNYVSHYTYHCMCFNNTITIDIILDVI